MAENLLDESSTNRTCETIMNVFNNIEGLKGMIIVEVDGNQREELRVGDRMTVCWDVPTRPDQRDWIGMFPLGTSDPDDYLDLKYRGVDSSQYGEVTWKLSDELFKEPETMICFRFYTASMLMLAESVPLKVINHRPSLAPWPSAQAESLEIYQVTVYSIACLQLKPNTFGAPKVYFKVSVSPGLGYHGNNLSHHREYLTTAPLDYSCHPKLNHAFSVDMLRTDEMHIQVRFKPEWKRPALSHFIGQAKFPMSLFLTGNPSGAHHWMFLQSRLKGKKTQGSIKLEVSFLRENSEKIDGLEPEVVDHSEPEVVDHSEPEVVDHSVPEVVDHSEPEVVDYSEPEVVDHSVPEVVDHSVPEVVDHSVPEVVDHSVPEVVDHSEVTTSQVDAKTVEPSEGSKITSRNALAVDHSSVHDCKSDIMEETPDGSSQHLSVGAAKPNEEHAEHPPDTLPIMEGAVKVDMAKEDVFSPTLTSDSFKSIESEERKSLIRQTLHGNHVLQHISSPVYPEQAMSHLQFNPPSPSREVLRDGSGRPVYVDHSQKIVSLDPPTSGIGRQLSCEEDQVSSFAKRLEERENILSHIKPFLDHTVSLPASAALPTSPHKSDQHDAADRTGSLPVLSLETCKGDETSGGEVMAGLQSGFDEETPDPGDIMERPEKVQSSVSTDELWEKSTVDTVISVDQQATEEREVIKSPSITGDRKLEEKITAIKDSPVYKFIARQDLYSYLRKEVPEDLGKEILSSANVLKMIQRIRVDPMALERYQHNSHLVTVLNKFAMVEYELPSDWTAKRDKNGKTFFVNHNARTTTYIDPRLPYPGHSLVPKSNRPVGLRIAILDADPTRPTVAAAEAVTSTALRQDTETNYNERVLQFLRQPNLYDCIATKFVEPVNNDLKAFISEICTSSEPLNHFQERQEMMELMMILSLFDNEILHGLSVAMETPQVAPAIWCSPVQIVAFFRRPDIYAVISRKLSLTQGIRTTIECITNGGEEVIEQKRDDPDINYLISLFSREIDGYWEEIQRPDISRQPSDFSSYVSPLAQSYPCTPREIYSFFMQSNIYSIILQRRPEFDLSLRSVVETVKMQGPRVVSDLINREHVLKELLDEFHDDIKSYNNPETGITTYSPEQSVRPCDLSTTEIARYFNEVPFITLESLHGPFSLHESDVINLLKVASDPTSELTDMRYRDPSAEDLIQKFARNIRDYSVMGGHVLTVTDLQEVNHPATVSYHCKPLTVADYNRITARATVETVPFEALTISEIGLYFHQVPLATLEYLKGSLSVNERMIAVLLAQDSNPTNKVSDLMNQKNPHLEGLIRHYAVEIRRFTEGTGLFATPYTDDLLSDAQIAAFCLQEDIREQLALKRHTVSEYESFSLITIRTADDPTEEAEELRRVDPTFRRLIEKFSGEILHYSKNSLELKKEDIQKFFDSPNIFEALQAKGFRLSRAMYDMIQMVHVSGIADVRTNPLYECVIIRLCKEINMFAESQLLTTNVVPGLSQAQALPNDTATLSSATRKPPTSKEKERFAALFSKMHRKLNKKLSLINPIDFKIVVRRSHLLEDAYDAIMKAKTTSLQFQNVKYEFDEEPGLDYGGPAREFFFCVSHELFNPYYGLFEYSNAGSYTLQISPFSAQLENHIQWFWFAGRFIGLAIIKDQLLDVFFAPHIYKILLQRPFDLSDLEAIDPVFYASLKYIKENDPADVGGLTFSVTEESFGEAVVKDLKPKGRTIEVTQKNKSEYLDLMVNWRLKLSTVAQSDALLKGFKEIVPSSCVEHFKPTELEWVIAGTPFVDIADWKANTLYLQGLNSSHHLVIWFWKLIEEYSNEQRLKVLQFVTGTSSIPFEGFKALWGSGEPQKFQISLFSGPPNCYPVAHTCFNRLDIPNYSSYEAFKEKLTLAVEGTEGFGNA